MTWIFGYGSLAWRPGFEYKSCIRGYIKGYRRVFWQGSTDHRGTPEAPGRTATLHEDADAITLAGTEEEQQQTIKYLEWREKQYDIRKQCDIYTADSANSPVVRNVLVYIASESPRNVNWLGPASLEAIAKQIANAVGPSGRNHEYLYRLADFMREISVEDQELFQLEGLVKKILAASETVHSMLDDQTGVASHASISATTVTLTADDQAHNGKSSKQHQLIAVSAVAATSD